MGRLKAFLTGSFYCAVCLLLGRGAWPVRAAESPFDIQTWQSDEGLPRPSILAMAQGPDGYLWLGTWDTRARFDGVHFTAYVPEHTPELLGFGISKIVADAYGKIWHATAGGGLACWSDGHWTRCLPDLGPGHSILEVFGEADGAALVVEADGKILRWENSGHYQEWPWDVKWGQPALNNVCLDKANNVWLITDAGDLVRAAAPNDQTIVVPGKELHGRQWHSLQADPGGNLWLGTERELAVRRNDTFEPVAPPAAEAPFDVEEIMPAIGGRLWVAANHRLWLWQNGAWVTNVCAWPPFGVPARARLVDRNGRLWLGTRGHGLLCLNTDGHPTVFTSKDGLLGDTVSALCEDRERNIWVGLDRAGLARLRPRRFNVVGPKEGLSVPVVSAICDDAAGAVWLGTDGGGLNRWYQGQITRYDLGWENTPGEVRSLLIDTKGTLLVGTPYKGMFQIEAGHLSVPLDMKRISYQVFAMCEAEPGILWIGNTKGLYRWDRQRDVLKSFGPAEGLTNLNVRAIVRDQAGTLWVGTYGGGIARLEGDHFVPCSPPGLPGEKNVSGLYADAAGTLWIATIGGGLCRLRGGQFTSYNTNRGMPDDQIAYLTEDGSGNLWLGSPTGIFRVGKSDLAALDEGKVERLSYLAFDKADGLPTRACTGGSQPACWRDREGRLWFGTDGGAVYINPDDFIKNALPPPVWIEQLIADGEFVSGPGTLRPLNHAGSSRQELEVRPGRQVLEFNYTATSLSASEKVQFKCMLEGLDKDWSPPTTRRTAAYYHVPPGHYQFHVIACNNDGVWNTTGAVLSLVLLPHFWQTWWFKLTAVGAAVLLLVGVYEIRLSRARYLERLRLRIGRDLHDEVGSNLSSIALLAQIMQIDAGEESATDAAEIRRIAKATIDSLRDIIWFLDPAYDRMSDLVAHMKETAGTMLRGVPFEFQVKGEIDNYPLSLTFRRNALPIFKEVLNNLIKYAHATRVEIVVEGDARGFRFVVRDNGTGFDEARAHKGNGLKNLRRRAAEMNGRLHIDTRPGHGTTVTLDAGIPRIRE